MKKLLNFFIKYDMLLVSIIVLIPMIVQVVLYFYLVPYDNLWNYGNIYKLSIGQVIYKDVNIIITPLFFYIAEVFLKIFGMNYLNFLIFGGIIISLLFILIYKIYKELGISKKYSLMFILINILLCNMLPMYAPNYNILALIFIELGILYTIKKQKIENLNKRFDFQPIIIMLVFMTNQKLGIGYAIGYIICEILMNKSKKQAITNILKNMMISIMIFLLILAIFAIKNNLYEFIDICFLGIFDFTKNIAVELRCIIKNVLLIITALLLIFVSKKYKKINSSNQMILISYAIGTNVATIPIFNGFHTELSIQIWSMVIFYSVYNILKDILKDKRIERIITIFVIVLIIINIILRIVIPVINTHKENIVTDNEILYGAIMFKEQKNNINEVEQYIKDKQIQGKDIKILSTYAMLYTLDLNIDNWYFDLPNNGNLGRNGEQKLINKIKEMKNTIMLVENEKKTKYSCYQFTSNVRDYVYQNYNQIDEIENYDVYEINN